MTVKQVVEEKYWLKRPVCLLRCCCCSMDILLPMGCRIAADIPQGAGGESCQPSAISYEGKSSAAE